jgi:hypothetical protein
MFAAGELAMTAEDLALWDLSILNHSLLKPGSYRELETETLLNNGLGTRYGLGISVVADNGHRTLFTDNCNSYLDATARMDLEKSLAPLGESTAFVQSSQRLRGGMTTRRFLVTFPGRKLSLSTYERPDGKIEQYGNAPAE